MSEALSHERPSLPASSSAFALPTSSRTTSADELNPFMLHLHKPSLLNPKLGHLSSSCEKRHRSPLASSFTHRRRRSLGNGEDSESDKDSKIWMSDRSSGSSSGNATPPQPDPNGAAASLDVDAQMKLRAGSSSSSSSSASSATGPQAPSTPPRNSSVAGMDFLNHILFKRRPSIPPKPLRIMSLVAESESRPEEAELKSEAQFQQLVASYSNNPLVPKTPRAPSDRGRYPEEAYEDEFQREDTPSDDEGEDGDSTFGFGGLAEPISISGRDTPAQSVSGDDGHMSMCGSPGGYAAMDVDSVFSFGSPSVSNAASSQWRYTPPPTSSAVRSSKRKHDDRYDPYPAAKRRAVSPSISYLRGSPRISIPVSIPITIPSSSASSANSSPVISQLPPSYYQPSYAVMPRSVGSPIVGSAIGLAASPVLRPMARSAIRREEGEKDVDSAGDGVNGLNLE